MCSVRKQKKKTYSRSRPKQSQYIFWGRWAHLAHSCVRPTNLLQRMTWIMKKVGGVYRRAIAILMISKGGGPPLSKFGWGFPRGIILGGVGIGVRKSTIQAGREGVWGSV